MPVDEETLSLELQKRRERITMLKSPLITSGLFCRHAARSIYGMAKKFLAHPATRFIVIPGLIVCTAVSVVAIPQIEDSAFNAIDVDRNGIVTAEEMAAFYHKEQTNNHTSTSFERFIASSGGADREAFVTWWKSASHIERGAHLHEAHPWREVEYFLADLVWWVGLGVLSSVGLGTGMHSGILFLFPHIFLTCAAAHLCGHTDFYTYPVNVFVGPRERTFQCISAPSPTDEVTFWTRFLKVTLWAMLWGAGTAFGEIPPYALSYAAARDGKKSQELDEVSKFDVLNRMKNWTFDKIQRYGFWAILLLAAWPNMAFDLCGMACGHYMMPFWTFFGATLLGKAVLKANFQAAFFVVLFSGNNIQIFIRVLAAKFSTATSIDLSPRAEAAIDVLNELQRKTALRASGQAEAEAEKSATIIQTAMSVFVIAAVGWFAMSIVDTFAQKEQEEADEKLLALLKKKSEKDAKQLIAAVMTKNSNSRVVDFVVVLAVLAVAAYGYATETRALVAFGLAATASNVGVTVLGEALGLRATAPTLLAARAVAVGVVTLYTLK